MVLTLLTLSALLAISNLLAYVRENPVNPGAVCHRADVVSSSMCETLFHDAVLPRRASTHRHRVVSASDLSDLAVDAGTCVLDTSAARDAARRVVDRLIGCEPSANESNESTSAYCLPSVILVGVQKAGTSNLLGWMERHPAIRVALEERHFFDKTPRVDARRVDTYAPYLFRSDFLLSPRELRDGVITVEKTPNYISDPDAARRMHELLPSARLIVSLRDPVTRTYSAWQHHCRARRYDDDGVNVRRVKTGTGNLIRCVPDAFERYLASGSMDALPVVRRGEYASQLRRLLSYYDPTNVLILFYEDMRSKPFETMRRVERFAGVASFPYESFTYVSSEGRVRLRGVPTKATRPYERMSETSRERLWHYFGGRRRADLQSLLREIFKVEIPDAW